VKTLFSRWLPAITKTPTRKAAFAATSLAIAGGVVVGPVLAIDSGAHGAPAAQLGVTATAPAGTPANAPAQAAPAASAATSTAPAPAATTAAPAPAPPAEKQLSVDYQAQVNFFFCGPAATRIVASAKGHNLSQDDVAGKLGTTVNGTPSAEDTTRVLNDVVGKDAYHTTAIPDRQPKPAQMDQLQADVVRAVSDGRGVVANIKGTAVDSVGTAHAYDGGHYIAVVGYNDQGRGVLIADPANVNGDDFYWMSTIDLTNWMATRGYSS
jgi:Peptidase_C39 like family